MGREPLRCPRCGVTFALVVGEVGPREPCQLAIEAERVARREARSQPHPCAEGCGREVIGAGTYCSGTCRSRAFRRRVARWREPMRVEPLLCSCYATTIGLVLVDVTTCERCGPDVSELVEALDEAEAIAARSLSLGANGTLPSGSAAREKGAI